VKSISKLHDGGGLYLWVHPDGKKYWRLRYKVDGKEKSLSLGVYPHTGLGAARARRDEAQRQRAAGTDPAVQRKAEKREKLLATENTFEAVAWEWFNTKTAKWVAGHTSDMRNRIKNDLLPILGSHRIDKIAPSDLRAVIAKMEARGAYDLCRRVLQMATQVFRYGMATEKCSSDPTVGLNKMLTKQKGRNMPSLPESELPGLLKAIAGYGADTGEQQTRIGLQLLATTFVRTSELINATWDEFDMAAALWTIPETRMKMRRAHLVPLSRQALALLEELRPLSGYSRYILPGRNAVKTMSNNTLLFALYRMGYKARMSGHGFRSVASTILNESGQWSRDAVELQLAHAERDKTRAAYNKAQRIEERKRMMQWWADYLDGLQTQSNAG
jgi:integrase